MSRRTTNLSQCDRASQNYTPFEGKVHVFREITIKRFAQVD